MPNQQEIVITRDAEGKLSFPPVCITQSQTVFWRNEDSNGAHWPIIPPQPGVEPPGVAPRFQIGLGNTSDQVQPYASAKQIEPGKEIDVAYGCKVNGHGAEKGIIKVVADFLPENIENDDVFNQLPDATAGQQYTPVPLTAGGRPPYRCTLSDATLPAGLQVKAEARGIVVSGKPSQKGNDFAFTVHCVDSLQNTIDQTYTIQVSKG